MTVQMRHIVQFAEEHTEQMRRVWEDPLMQDLLSHIMMERGLAQIPGSGVDPLTMEFVLLWLVIAYVAGQERMKKAGVLQRMLGIDASILDKIICPGCGWVGDGTLPPTACPQCQYENGHTPFRLLTLRELLNVSGADYNDVSLGEFLRALKGLGLLIVPEEEDSPGSF